ncbi:kinase-like domain-containing protein, partial [Glomus cerebriforme]
MTGIDDLKDLDVSNTEHYKRINIGPSLEDENYEAFGSIISKKKRKLEEFYVTFGLYDLNGFSATIKTLRDTSIIINECYILWAIIGNPTKLSVFSPKNRELHVDSVKESITLQPDSSFYSVKTSCQLSKGCTISFNAYCSTANYEPKIKLIGWSEDDIYFQIVESIYSNLDNSNIMSDSYDQIDDDNSITDSDYNAQLNKYDDFSTNIELTICIFSSDYESLKIDNRKVDDSEYSLDLIGYSLTENTEVVPLTKFLPLMSEIDDNLNEIIEITKAAKYNKQICEALKQRVNAINLAGDDLKRIQGCFNNINYLILDYLVVIIKQIKTFVGEISQMNTWLENREETFKDLCRVFDSSVNELTFVVMIKNTDDLGQLTADQEDLIKYQEEMESDIKKFNSEITGIGGVKKTEENNNEVKTYVKELTKEFSSTVLKVSDYKKTSKVSCKRGCVTKWVNIRDESEEFAFKSISKREDQRSIQNQVTIFKELYGFQNIIRFYGLIYEGDQWYLVTEWAEYGNLRAFYTNFKGRFDLRLKLRISLDIARGLKFLRTLEIVHCDIRAKNILITHNETAKLTNFRLSHKLNAVALEPKKFNAATLKQSQNLDRARYYAPELLDRVPNFNYDHKCEVYSFGILLWEIAEEKAPYEDYKDIVKITDIVRNKYRETFSEKSRIPEAFKSLALDAVNHDPELRPEITKIVEVLSDCFESFEKSSHTTLFKHSDYKKISEHSSSLSEVNISSEEIVPFIKFSPLINEIGNILNEVIDIAQAAEHNKRICNSLKQRVYAANLAVFGLKVRRDEQEYFNKKNYLCLQNL